MEEKRGLVRWLRPELQKPGGSAARAGAQAELPIAATPKKKGRRSAQGVAPAGAGAGSAAGIEKRAWPKELPAQVAAARDLLAEAGRVGAALRLDLYNRSVTHASADERRWIEQWRSAGPALAEVRRRELALLTDEQARVAALELLALAAVLPIDPLRLTTSGLIEQQALLHGRR